METNGVVHSDNCSSMTDFVSGLSYSRGQNLAEFSDPKHQWSKKLELYVSLVKKYKFLEKYSPEAYINMTEAPNRSGGSAFVMAPLDDLNSPEIASYPDITDFKLFQMIGKGAFSTVYKAVNIEHGYIAALKIISKSNLHSKQRDAVNKEVYITKRIKHAYIVRLLDYRETPLNYLIILEYMSGGELYNTLRDQVCFPEGVCRKIIFQIAKAIEYLHDECGIVHRDIKLENILFENIDSFEVARKYGQDADEQIIADPDAGKNIGTVKIADFGLSKIIHNTSTHTPCGTAGYIAPEILKHGIHSKGVDVWALGCILYTILCGFPPFFDDSPKGLTDKVSNGQYAFLSPWWDFISIESKDLISRLLEIDPIKRYTIKDVLKHPWIKCETFDTSYIPSPKLLSFLNGGDISATKSSDVLDISPLTYSSIQSDNHHRTLRTSTALSYPPNLSCHPSNIDYFNSPNCSSDVPLNFIPPSLNTPANPADVPSDFSCPKPYTPTTEQIPLINHLRTKIVPPTELCSKDILSAPLNIYQSMCDDANVPTTLQFVKVYNGNGAIPNSITPHSNHIPPNSSSSHVSQYPTPHIGCSISPSSQNSSQPNMRNPVSSTNINTDEVSVADRVPATEIKIIHGLRRHVRNFKLDMETSPLYNRRRRARVGIAN